MRLASRLTRYCFSRLVGNHEGWSGWLLEVEQTGGSAGQKAICWVDCARSAPHPPLRVGHLEPGPARIKVFVNLKRFAIRQPEYL